MTFQPGKLFISELGKFLTFQRYHMHAPGLHASTRPSHPSGRKRKTTERSDRFIAKCSKLSIQTKKEIANELKNKTVDGVSPKTIQRRIREKGITW